MKKIGLLSDTHGFVHPELAHYFEHCNEIWHAGDFGTLAVVEALQAIKPLRGVSGNIDGNDIRFIFSKHLRFYCEGVDVLMTHIGGYPGRYSPQIREIISANPPKLLVCGHSHILRVIYDQRLKMLTLNPGAAGKSGFHQKITLCRFSIDQTNICDLEVIELKKPEKGHPGHL